MQDDQLICLDIRPTVIPVRGAGFQLGVSPYARAYAREQVLGLEGTELHLEIDIYVSDIPGYVYTLERVADYFGRWRQTKAGQKSNLTSVTRDPGSDRHIIFKGVVDKITYTARPTLVELQRLVRGELVRFGTEPIFAASET